MENYNKEQKVKNFLSQTQFWIINKSLTRSLGIEASLLLSDLITKHDYFKEYKTLQKDGSFFNNKEQIEIDTTLSPHKQSKALDILQGRGLVTVVRRGIPPRYFYLLDFNAISELMDNGC